MQVHDNDGARCIPCLGNGEALAPAVIKCGCGKSYAQWQFETLRLCGYQTDDLGAGEIVILILRDCTCGSTISMAVWANRPGAPRVCSACDGSGDLPTVDGDRDDDERGGKHNLAQYVRGAA